MTYDKAMFTFVAPTDVEAAVLTRHIPYTESDEIDVEVGEVEETADGFGRFTVTVIGDEYGIQVFEDELPEKAVGKSEVDADRVEQSTTIEELEAALGDAKAYYWCDVEVGAGEPQPADKHRMNDA